MPKLTRPFDPEITRGLHVLPSFQGEREHDADRECWCDPEINFVAENGARVWLHHREQ
jgi:hypothetical protein